MTRAFPKSESSTENSQTPTTTGQKSTLETAAFKRWCCDGGQAKNESEEQGLMVLFVMDKTNMSTMTLKTQEMNALEAKGELKIANKIEGKEEHTNLFWMDLKNLPFSTHQRILANINKFLFILFLFTTNEKPDKLLMQILRNNKHIRPSNTKILTTKMKIKNFNKALSTAKAILQKYVNSNTNDWLEQI